MERRRRTDTLWAAQGVRTASVVCAMAFAMLCSGCVALVAGAAGGAAGVVYVMGKLKDEQPYDVPTVHRAVLAGLKDLSLTLSENKADQLSAHVESEFADGEHVWIDLSSLPDSRTALTIRVGITGNERRARAIHDAVRRHLPASQNVSGGRVFSMG